MVSIQWAKFSRSMHWSNLLNHFYSSSANFIEPKIILQRNVSDAIRESVIGFATEALEQHGLSQVSRKNYNLNRIRVKSIYCTILCVFVDFRIFQDLADTVRSKCDETYEPYWNCIVGRNIHAFALSTNEINSATALVEFTFGSIHFLIFQTN